jgi:hypothetical protein
LVHWFESASTDGSGDDCVNWDGVAAWILHGEKWQHAGRKLFPFTKQVATFRGIAANIDPAH